MARKGTIHLGELRALKVVRWCLALDLKKRHLVQSQTLTIQITTSPRNLTGRLIILGTMTTRAGPTTISMVEDGEMPLTMIGERRTLTIPGEVTTIQTRPMAGAETITPIPMPMTAHVV